jgi:hypothetical protein
MLVTHSKVDDELAQHKNKYAWASACAEFYPEIVP